MRTLLATIGLMCLAAMLTLPLASCREEGPAERMGRGIDDAGDELRDAAEDVRDQQRRDPDPY
jgi:hypothetical protein